MLGKPVLMAYCHHSCHIARNNHNGRIAVLGHCKPRNAYTASLGSQLWLAAYIWNNLLAQCLPW